MQTHVVRSDKIAKPIKIDVQPGRAFFDKSSPNYSESFGLRRSFEAVEMQKIWIAHFVCIGSVRQVSLEFTFKLLIG